MNTTHLRKKESAIKTVHLSYFASLREDRGLFQESIKTDSTTAGDLYTELQNLYGFCLGKDAVRVSINETFVSWPTLINDNDRVVFIPPVSGG